MIQKKSAFLVVISILAFPQTSKAVDHELSLTALQNAQYMFGVNTIKLNEPTDPKWHPRFDAQHLTYGDFNGDGKEDVATVFVQADGAADSLVLIINDNGIPKNFFSFPIRNQLVEDLKIQPNKIVLTSKAAGTKQTQTLEFTKDKTNPRVNWLVLDMPHQPSQEKVGPDWLSYKNTRYQFSLKYPPYLSLMEQFDGTDIFIQGNLYKELMEIEVRPVWDSFEGFALHETALHCDADGPDSGSYGDSMDVKKTALSIGGIAGYKMYVQCRDRDSHAFIDRTEGPIYAFDITKFGIPKFPPPAKFGAPPPAIGSVLLIDNVRTDIDNEIIGTLAFAP